MLPAAERTGSLLLSVAARDAHHPAGSGPRGGVAAGVGGEGSNTVHHSLIK